MWGGERPREIAVFKTPPGGGGGGEGMLLF